MKQLILSILLLLAFAGLCYSDAGFIGELSQTPASGSACSYVEKDEIFTGNTTTDSTGLLGNTADSGASNILVGSNYNMHRVVLRLKKVGAPTGTLYFYIYDPDNAGAEGPPDDKLATASTTINVADLPELYAEFNIDFATTQASVISGNVYLVAYYFDATFGNADNHVLIGGDTYIGSAYGRYSRVGAPGDTNDSANWSTVDADGQAVYKTYDCE